MQDEAVAQARLTRDEVVRKLNDPKPACKRLDLRASDLAGLNLSNLTFRDVVFGCRRSKAQASLERTDFGGSSFHGCFFADMELERTDFRHCRFEHCDFRYTRFHLVTLANSTIVGADFYRAKFDEGTILTDTRLVLSSLQSARLDGATGMRWRMFARGGKDPPLIQEVADATEYARFLERTHKDRRKDDTSDKAVRRRFADAAAVYRTLSGLFTSRGQFNAAGSAYARSRRLERMDALPRYRELRARKRNRRRDHARGERVRSGTPHPHRSEPSPQQPSPRPISALASWVWLYTAGGLCGFGENLQRVIAWMVVLALLPGIAYWLGGGIGGANGVPDYLLFSTSQLVAEAPADLDANRLVEWTGVLQKMCGVALIGLFGFILGNKIRNS